MDTAKPNGRADMGYSDPTKILPTPPGPVSRGALAKRVIAAERATNNAIATTVADIDKRLALDARLFELEEEVVKLRTRCNALDAATSELVRRVERVELSLPRRSRRRLRKVLAAAGIALVATVPLAGAAANVANDRVLLSPDGFTEWFRKDSPNGKKNYIFTTSVQVDAPPVGKCLVVTGLDETTVAVSCNSGVR